ncbi:TasA family protein [Bacillus marinisedimentorum]|uniref:TasA family protein n=1 Tax=Bacillus marinisedimentorum TaxID=1821260 RepID=UPI0007E01A40|nr:TasA family protein [Bacillus marinisedimentorum]
MSIKKKLTMGAMAAAMGVSLIGAGTWAAFNDIENVNASMAAGELELELAQANGPMHFNISNLKPGDHMTREIKLVNDGSLAIKDVLLSIDNFEFRNYGEDIEATTEVFGSNTGLEFLDQFEISLVKTGNEGGPSDFPKTILGPDSDVTLADVYRASGGDSDAKNTLAAAVHPDYWTDGRINVATINPNEWTGLPLIPEDDDIVEITITFKDDKEKVDGLYVQNKFQGDEIDVEFTLEARQWGGQEITDTDMNGNDVETNRKANNGDPIAN